MSRPKGIVNKKKNMIENDQGDIRKLISEAIGIDDNGNKVIVNNNNIGKVWNRIQGIAFKFAMNSKDIIDIDDAYMVFIKSVIEYDPEQSNNFILFYKTRLEYARSNELDRMTCLLTENRKIINSLKKYSSSPNDDEMNDFAKDFTIFM